MCQESLIPSNQNEYLLCQAPSLFVNQEHRHLADPFPLSPPTTQNSMSPSPHAVRRPLRQDTIEISRPSSHQSSPPAFLSPFLGSNANRSSLQITTASVPISYDLLSNNHSPPSTQSLFAKEHHTSDGSDSTNLLALATVSSLLDSIGNTSAKTDSNTVGAISSYMPTAGVASIVSNRKPQIEAPSSPDSSMYTLETSTGQDMLAVLMPRRSALLVNPIQNVKRPADSDQIDWPPMRTKRPKFESRPVSVWDYPAYPTNYPPPPPPVMSPIWITD